MQNAQDSTVQSIEAATTQKLQDQEAQTAQAELGAQPDANAEAIFDPSQLVNHSKSATDFEALRDQLMQWAKENPAAALAFAETIEPHNLSLEARSAILLEWAKHEPASAWQWANENSVHDCVNLLHSIGRSEPAMAWGFANDYVAAYPEQRYTSFERLFEGIAYGGEFELAMELIESSDIAPNKDAKDGKYSFVETVMEQWAAFAPGEVAEYLKSLPDAYNSPRVSLTHSVLIPHWARQEPYAVLDYALELNYDSVKARKTAFELGLQELARRDLYEATEWLNNNDQGPEFDWSIADLATNQIITQFGPELAMEWVQTISRDDLRNESLVEIATVHLMEDPEQARELFAAAGYLSQVDWQRARMISEERLRPQETLAQVKDYPVSLDGTEVEGYYKNLAEESN